MQIVPMRDLKDTVKIEKLCLEAEGPVFVTKNGYGKLVVMDIKFFENLLNKIYEAKVVNEAIVNMDKIDERDGRDVLDEIKLKYGL